MAELTFNVAASGDDGRVSGSSATYPISTATAVGTGAQIWTNRSLSGATYFQSVILLLWDTSSLPDAATVDAVTLRLYVTNTGDADGRDLTVEWYDAGTIGDEDWTNTPGTDAHAGADISAITIAADNDFALINVSNVNKTGYTGLRLHISGATPTGDNLVQIASFDHATLTEPRLIVDYTLSGAGRIFRRFYGPALLTNVAADLYTVPTGKRATIRHIHVSNPTASPVDFTLSIGTDAAGTRLYDDYPVPAEDIKQEFRDHTLVEDEKIQGYAGTTNVLNLTVDGYEESL